MTRANDTVICKKRIFLPGVFTYNQIAEKGKNIITIYNTTDKTVEIDKNDLNIDYESTNKYDIYGIQNKTALQGQERIEYVMSNLKLDHCNKLEKRIVRKLVTEYSDVFHVENDPITIAKGIVHHIALFPGSNPTFTKQYKLAHKQREILEMKIKEMLENDIIEPSTSAWNSPLLVIPKKDAADEFDYRICVDFKKVNKLTQTETYPMPDLDEELPKMHGAKIFSSIDIFQAFLQIDLKKEDREITGFQTADRKYQYKRMPFGLKGSPITWQRFIMKIVADLTSKGVMAYMDDIMLHSPSVDVHTKVLIEIFKKMREHNLKLKISKTKLFCKELKYLGHVISEDGVKADPRNVEAITSFVRPKSIEKLQSFLGMSSYYRKFIHKYAQIARPLQELLKKDSNFVWNEKCEIAFELLKKLLTTAPVLCFPDFTKTFYIIVDASFYAVGAYISNYKAPNDRPIEYFSKSLNSAQINYATTHKELLAIIMAIERFNHYIWGKHFVVYTDHQALTYLMNQHKPGSRLSRAI